MAFAEGDLPVGIARRVAGRGAGGVSAGAVALVVAVLNLKEFQRVAFGREGAQIDDVMGVVTQDAAASGNAAPQRLQCVGWCSST